jgi:hypothetical protein
MISAAQVRALRSTFVRSAEDAFPCVLVIGPSEPIDCARGDWSAVSAMDDAGAQQIEVRTCFIHVSTAALTDAGITNLTAGRITATLDGVKVTLISQGAGPGATSVTYRFQARAIGVATAQS